MLDENNESEAEIQYFFNDTPTFYTTKLPNNCFNNFNFYNL